MYTETAADIRTDQPHITSVRSLVEFVLKAGDLISGGFHRRDRAQAGMQAHKRVQRSRSEGYRPEVEITYQVEGVDPHLEVRGRIDALYVNDKPAIPGLVVLIYGIWKSKRNFDPDNLMMQWPLIWRWQYIGCRFFQWI